MAVQHKRRVAIGVLQPRSFRIGGVSALDSLLPGRSTISSKRQ
ncbi:hypothetical protein ANCCAN_28535 [Ancylostoma caninum]|uniref:Uncharacterized protein n=1 Tax=Ancylostoma caninum TaxID=29170 RepID=A0A368F420_ANCCA|nr:hypothetical protein ANCCAN_28535 [Ancylostoma caninum]